jgi:CobQ/CobB/MinD/ParA nucleotide binding domain
MPGRWMSEPPQPAGKLHFVLQGKGGVGKTVVALLLSQCIQESGEPVICVDTDPVNASLSSLSSFNPERVSIFTGKKVDTRSLDLFTEMLLTKDAHFVVDNGASSFVPVSQYLIENDVTGILVEAGRQPVVHVVVTGGPGMLDTMNGLASILQDFPPAFASSCG